MSLHSALTAINNVIKKAFLGVGRRPYDTDEDARKDTDNRFDEIGRLLSPLSSIQEEYDYECSIITLLSDNISEISIPIFLKTNGEFYCICQLQRKFGLPIFYLNIEDVSTLQDMCVCFDTLCMFEWNVIESDSEETLPDGLRGNEITNHKDIIRVATQYANGIWHCYFKITLLEWYCVKTNKRNDLNSIIRTIEQLANYNWVFLLGNGPIGQPQLRKIDNGMKEMNIFLDDDSNGLENWTYTVSENCFHINFNETGTPGESNKLDVYVNFTQENFHSLCVFRIGECKYTTEIKTAQIEQTKKVSRLISWISKIEWKVTDMPCTGDTPDQTQSNSFEEDGHSDSLVDNFKLWIERNMISSMQSLKYTYTANKINVKLHRRWELDIHPMNALGYSKCSFGIPHVSSIIEAYTSSFEDLGAVIDQLQEFTSMPWGYSVLTTYHIHSGETQLQNNQAEILK